MIRAHTSWCDGSDQTLGLERCQRLVSRVRRLTVQLYGTPDQPVQVIFDAGPYPARLSAEEYRHLLGLLGEAAPLLEEEGHVIITASHQPNGRPQPGQALP